jgi:hypothetical protein
MTGDFVFLVPGTKFWPQGTGWPNNSNGITMTRTRSLSTAGTPSRERTHSM